MDKIFVCRVCLAADDLEMIFKKENKDLLSKLRLVGGVSIVKDDHLPQCICQVCSCELQFAFDLLSQYEATCNKLRIATRHHTNVKEKPPTAYFHEKKQEARAEQIQKEMQAAKADNTLVAEIVVKEEMFSDDEDEIAGLESKDMPENSKDNFVYKIEVVNDSNEENGEKMPELNSNRRLYDRKTDDENCQVQNDFEEGLKELSHDESSMGSEITVIEVKEDTDTEESFEQNNGSHTVEPEYESETCEALISKDTKQNEENECGGSNKRSHDDFQAQQIILCDHRTVLRTPEYLKCEKYVELSKQNTYLLKLKDGLHSNPELQICDKWDKSLENGRLLEKNLISDAIKCELRDKMFPSKKISRQRQITQSNPEFLACDKYGKTFKYTFRIREHQKWHLNPNGFKCKQCGKRFSSKTSLRKHKIKHSNPELRTCNTCGKTFPYLFMLRNHKEWHLNPDAFKCKQCDKKFSSKSNLANHTIIHSNPELCTCNKCGKTFSNVSMLRQHHKWHLNPDAFTCKECGKQFSAKHNLKKHGIVHSNPELLTCDKCGKSFATEHLINEHQMLHLNPNAFKCKQCDKRFSSKSTLGKHRITHSNPELLTCEKCGKSFAKKLAMKEHQILHLNPNAFKCKQCDKRFLSKTSLISHTIVHSKPDLLTCSKCGKSFARKHSMNEHQLLHSNPDAFKCKQCGKIFSSKGTLRIHAIKHSNPDLLTCDKCGKTFSKVSMLREHQECHLNPNEVKK